MVTHNLDIIDLCWWLVANCGSCWMETGDWTAEYLQMVAVMEGYHLHMAWDTDQCISHINYHCQWQYIHNSQRILNYPHCVVAANIHYHHVNPYAQSAVEFRLSTYSLNHYCGNQQATRDMMYNKNDHVWVYWWEP
jgi:hypothetical protein